VIIACEKCSTRFQLDDAQVPPAGVKVRCSRCRHAFVVRAAEAEAASDEQAARGHARQAARQLARSREAGDGDLTQALAGARPPPDRTQVLDRSAALGGDDADEESDWQFNEDPEPQDPEPEPRAAAGSAAPVAEVAPDPASELFGGTAPVSDPTLADVGSPEDWDLLGGADAGELAEAPPAGARSAPGESAASAPAAAWAESLPLEPAPPIRSRAASAAGWLAVAVLALVAVGGALRPPPRAGASAGGAVELAGLRVEQVRGETVENAVAGPILVVAARLANHAGEARAAGTSLRVRLLDATGAALADSAPLGRDPGEDRIRGGEPNALAVEQAASALALATTSLAPGEGVDVAAVFPALPREARGFRFELGPAPPPSPAASPPSSPPSSE
jgi:predicted Zn finger-like uncharacterized protein